MPNLEYRYVRVLYLETQVPLRGSLGQEECLVIMVHHSTSSTTTHRWKPIYHIFNSNGPPSPTKKLYHALSTHIVQNILHHHNNSINHLTSCPQSMASEQSDSVTRSIRVRCIPDLYIVTKEERVKTAYTFHFPKNPIHSQKPKQSSSLPPETNHSYFRPNYDP